MVPREVELNLSGCRGASTAEPGQGSPDRVTLARVCAGTPADIVRGVLRGLVVDFGGVLTDPGDDPGVSPMIDTDVGSAFGAELDPPFDTNGDPTDDTPVDDTPTARPVDTDAGSGRLAGAATTIAATAPGSRPYREPPLLRAVRVARRHGVRTALLSNADTLAVGRDSWAAVFDSVVLSGEVGFGKPDLRIYLLAAERIGLPPESCVFVDDLAGNVHGAVRAGMVGVHHQDVHTTLDELAVLFGFALR